MDRGKFQGFAEHLATFCLRAKGFLTFADAPGEVHVFHLVGFCAALECRPELTIGTGSRLVVIVRAHAFEAHTIERQFQDCAGSASPHCSRDATC